MSTGEYVQVVFCGIMMAFIVVGNAFVVSAYYSNSRLRTPMYTFLVSLAVSDFLVGTVSLPLWMFFTTSADWQQEEQLYRIYLSFDIFSALASIFHLTAVSLERWLAVCRPFYHHTLSRRAYTASIVAVWATAFVISLLRWVFQRLRWSVLAIQFYTPLLFAVGCIGPGLIIAFTNYKVFQVAKSLAQALPIPGQILDKERAELSGQVRGQRRTALTLTFLSVLFFISWTPFFILSTVAVFSQESLPSYASVEGLVLYTVSKMLQYCSSALNPLVYAFRDREIRRTFLELLLKCWTCFRCEESAALARIHPRELECAVIAAAADQKSVLMDKCTPTSAPPPAECS